MLFVLVTGPNASGKTTMVEGLAERYPQAPVAFLHPDTDGYYKQAPSIMFRRILAKWNDSTPVVVLEGTNRPTLQVINCSFISLVQRELAIYCLTQPPDVMEAHLRHRCEVKGKKYREDYWSRDKLEYEGLRRYPNLVKQASVPAETYAVDRDFSVLVTVADRIAARIDAALGR